MQIKKIHIASALTMLLYALLMIGCQNQTTDVAIDPIEKDIVKPAPTEKEDPPIDSIDKKDNDAHISSSPETEKETTEGSTAEVEEETSEPVLEPTDDGNNETNYDAAAPYNPNKPTLMGLTINLSKDTIKAKFGMPNEEYVMDDPNDPITVYEYTGFMIGYNKQNLIAFIDVNSDRVNPGLNGLKLGDSVDVAIQALGNPDTRTDYVMNYKSKETNLKLDIDPSTNTINSIKLFGTN